MHKALAQHLQPTPIYGMKAGMTLTFGLCTFVMMMLLKGQGMAVAGAFWAISVLYTIGLGAPSVWFASTLFMLGLLALIGQLVLNLQE